MRSPAAWRKSALNLLYPIRKLWHSKAITEVETCIQKHFGNEAAAKYASKLFLDKGATGHGAWIEMQLVRSRNGSVLTYAAR